MTEIVHTDRVVWRELSPGGPTEPLAVPVIERPIINGLLSVWYADIDGVRYEIEASDTYSDFLLRVAS